MVKTVFMYAGTFAAAMFLMVGGGGCSEAPTSPVVSSTTRYKIVAQRWQFVPPDKRPNGRAAEHLVTVDFTTGETTVLTECGSTQAPVWDQDGNILFHVNEPGDSSRIVKMDEYGRQLHVFEDKREAGLSIMYPFTSVTGEWWGHLEGVHGVAETGGVEVHTPFGASFSAGLGGYSPLKRLKISPNGQWIVCESGREPGTLLLFDARRPHLAKTLNWIVGGPAYTPAWSPDGKTIAFSFPTPSGGRNLGWIKRDANGDFTGWGGSQVGTFTADSGQVHVDPCYSADGKYLFYCRQESLGRAETGGRPNFRIWAIDLATSKQRQISPGGSFRNIDVR